MTRRRVRGILLNRCYLRYPLSGASRVIHATYDVADTVTVFGAPRSGTTWVQEMLSSGHGTCPLFEPLHEERVLERLGLGPGPVVGRGESAPELAAYLRTVMRGGAVTPWMLRLATVGDVLTARRFVVKHVQLSLSAGWVSDTFPTSPSIVIVRHPCAVVQSMLAVVWKPTATSDHLKSVAPEQARQITELLDGRTSEAAYYAATWAVEVRALLGDTEPPRTRLVSYEDAVADPAGVLGRVMEETGLPRPDDLSGLAGRPSAMTSADSVVRQAGDPTTGWTDALSREQQLEVLAVAEQAGVAGYGLDPRPDLEALNEQHRAPARARDGRDSGSTTNR